MKLTRRALIERSQRRHKRANNARHGRPKVVVIGGGAGGATAARYIAKDSKGEIDVTLVEPSRQYYTCFFSNLYLGGFRSMDSIGHSYGTLAAEYGINVVHDWAVGIDRGAKGDIGRWIDTNYDRLILSPGIDFIDGSVLVGTLHHKTRCHTHIKQVHKPNYKASNRSMPQGGVYAMTPPNPYRCPPGHMSVFQWLRTC